MASRSLKPQMALRLPRPPLGRTSSSSSDVNRESPTIATPAANSPSHISPSLPAVESPKTSVNTRPIAIQLPLRRSGPAVTPPAPLTGRGEVLGGYFPFHEDNDRPYLARPFQHESTVSQSQPTVLSTSPPPLATLTLSGPVSDMPKSHSGEVGHGDQSLIPDAVLMPKGKYYPSNYNAARGSTKSGDSPPRHARQGSDIKKKLQQYQRDMVAQARLASRMAPKISKPTSPRLLPLGSPGPITPLELEESGGYLAAGSRAAAASPAAQQELLNRMLRNSQESPGHSGPSSPVISAGGR